MSAASVTTAGRAAAEALHLDTFTVYRATGAKTTDPTALVETDVFATVLAGVKGKFQFNGNQSGEVTVPGQQVAKTNMEWHTSVLTLGVLTGDQILCTAAGPFSDPQNVGVRVRVTGPFLKSLATARRFQVEELT